MERTNYMQLLMTVTYPDICLEAIKTKFDGAWERLIAKRVLRDYLDKHSEACELMDYAMKEDPSLSVQRAALAVGYLITSSKIPENAQH